MAHADDRAGRHIDKLRSGDYRALEREVAHKRLAWLDGHGYPKRHSWTPHLPDITPRQAFALFFSDYLGAKLTDLPVVEESEDRITWLSKNSCATLDSCATLRLDTRVVCRAVYEKPTQLFFSRLDPGLRFVRNYEEIRPHAGHCRESIIRLDLEALMREALEEAWAAKAEGNRGYGAVLVMGDRVVARAHDSASTEGDPSRHGELKAICEAARVLGSPDLCGALLISTCEPCPMCAALSLWANVTTVIYGSSIAGTAAMGRTRIRLGLEEMAARSPFTVEVMGGLLKPECDALYA
jgi:tRNA(Arg) A34 adenosine deaminase TadA